MANDKDIEAAVGKVRKGNGNILIDDGDGFQGFRQVLNEGLHLLACRIVGPATVISMRRRSRTE